MGTRGKTTFALLPIDGAPPFPLVVLAAKLAARAEGRSPGGGAEGLGML